MFQIKLVEKIHTHILCAVTVLRISCRLWDSMKKYMESVRPQITVRRMRFAYWINKATHNLSLSLSLSLSLTHRMCNTYCFSTETIVSWRRLIVTLYLHCLCYDDMYILLVVNEYWFKIYGLCNTLRLRVHLALRHDEWCFIESMWSRSSLYCLLCTQVVLWRRM